MIKSGQISRSRSPVNVEIYIAVLFIVSALTCFYWWMSTGGIRSLLNPYSPPGQSYYLISKLAGLLGFLLLTFQIVLGLAFKSDTINCSQLKLKKMHKCTGIIMVTVLLTHVVTLLLAVSMRNEQFAWKILVPQFNKDYYQLALALGIVSVALLLLTMVSGILLYKRLFSSRYLHRIGILGFGLALIHSYMIGTDTKHSLFMLIYIVSGIGVAYLLFRRYFHSMTSSMHK